MISIVLTVYNGEKYITEQIQSIVRQSVTADEVIIMDDGSTDSTIKIISEFITANKLSDWNLYVNEENLGWRRNFIEGLKRSKGNYVFLCDQDDVWYHNKIERMTEILVGNNGIELLASTYTPLLEDNKNVLEKRTLKSFGKNKGVSRKQFNEKFLYVEYPGCVYALRRSLVNEVIAEWYERSAHDSLAWRLAMLRDSLYILDEPLIYYRRHENSATAKKRNRVNDKIQDCKFWLHVIENLSSYISVHSVENANHKQNVLVKAKRFAKARLKLYETLNIMYWIPCCMYYKYYFSIKSLFGDLYYVIRRK